MINIKKSRGQILAEKIKLSESPWSDFDSAYSGMVDGRETYYLTKHNEEGLIIKRVNIPTYRYIAGCLIGRKLNRNEVVHHIDENPLNNSPENLQVITRLEHNALHRNIEKGITTVKGSHYYTDGVNNIRLKDGDEIPEGFKKGRTLSSNALDNIRRAASRPKSEEQKLKISNSLKQHS